MAKTELQELREIRERYRNKKMVFCSGSFDLTHAGHVLFFEDCKKRGDVLVVGIGPDKIVRKEKSQERPILNEYLRLKMIRSLKPVDHAFIMRDTPKNTEHPLAPLYRILKKLNPDVYVVNDDASHLDYRKSKMKKLNVTFVTLRRTCPPQFKKISTSKIIKKIHDMGRV